MSEMSNQNSENNGVNRAGPVGEGSSPGRFSLVPLDPVVILLLSEQSGLKTWIRLLWNASLEVSLLMMTVSQLEDTDKEWCRNGKNTGVFESPSNDCVTKQELLGKKFGGLIWSSKIFGGW